MSIKKKIIISNILMIVIPVFLVLAVVFTALMGTKRYWDAYEDMYTDEDQIYSAQSLIYVYKDDISNAENIRELERELGGIGYRFTIFNEEDVFFSNLNGEDEEYLDDLFEGPSGKSTIVTMYNETYALIKDVFTNEAGEECTIIALMNQAEVKETARFTVLEEYVLKMLILVLGSIVLMIAIANMILARWLSKSILVPLKKLQEGTKNISEGNLDFQIDYDQPDEFGNVCEDFNEMRVHLKESVQTKLQYEQYRTEMIAGISHDLRTPLTSINAYVCGLRDGIAGTEDKKEHYYAAIQTRVEDMEKLVENLSDFHRVDDSEGTLMPESTGIADFVMDFLSDNEEDFKRNHVEPSYVDLSENQLANMDVREMKRVFLNIVYNSVKYREKEITTLTICTEKKDSMVKIRISDDGPGVDARELEHIFASFYRGDASRNHPAKGSGLGLSIARRIVENHHGSIHAENEGGLTIVIEIPGGTEDEENINCGG